MIAMRSKTRTGRHGGDDRLLVENSAGTISMGDPYATRRRQNVVTPWSKKHPDGGSATAQRTGSVTCNAIPSAQVVHSTPQSVLSEPRIRAARDG
jgi:hypothetical protein